jgi:multidrug transporter EmrE-like cation transporter
VSGWIYLSFTIIATVTAQIAFKRHFINNRFLDLVLAIGLFCLAVPFTFLAAHQMGIGRVYVGSALSYVMTPIAARYAFGEHLDKRQWGALALIVTGVIVYNT